MNLIRLPSGEFPDRVQQAMPMPSWQPYGHFLPPSPHSLTPLPLSHLSTCFCFLIYKAAGHLGLHLSPQGRNNGSSFFIDKISAVKHPTLFFALRCSKHHLLCWSDQKMETAVYMYIAFKKKCSLMAGLIHI